MEAATISVLRGKAVESRHDVRFAVTKNDDVLASAGDIDRSVFPRSAIKSLQALPLIESGAADAFGLEEAELALASASHGGQPCHVDRVRSWLHRIGLDQNALACGAHLPGHAATAADLLRRDEAPSSLHNNCSGKHAGMLTLALHLGADIESYLLPEHPVQQRIAAALADMAGVDRLGDPGIDGCGVPAFELPLASLARAMALFADPGGLEPAREKACRRLGASIRAFPELISGTGRPCTMIMQHLPHIIAKVGAEGVYTAVWPDRGLGIAVKIEDGATRAGHVALLEILRRLGAINVSAATALRDFSHPKLRNCAGTEVGAIEPAQNWPMTDASL